MKSHHPLIVEESDTFLPSPRPSPGFLLGLPPFQRATHLASYTSKDSSWEMSG
jgi:hypothetical protein